LIILVSVWRTADPCILQ